ncbi:hypothetical protein [Marinivivus vitaminiproducens]|uniref:hypothetical protein n=1 Tax=Marinivivus vitaminiproducens TaxID=3035935 RepID=UPI0027A5B084|nr:hypothetical protein P4R82_06950 [Geminicoccaceae bacterium SCSIO 64248]
MSTLQGTAGVDWVRAAQMLAADRLQSDIVAMTGCTDESLSRRLGDPVFSRLVELERERGANRQGELHDRLSQVVTDALIGEMQGETRNVRVMMWMADRLQILKPTIDGQMTDALQRLIGGLGPVKRQAYDGMMRNAAANDDMRLLSNDGDPKKVA